MKTLEITLVKSLAGRLRKISDVSVQPDNEATRGKINTIAHLVEVSEK